MAAIFFVLSNSFCFRMMDWEYNEQRRYHSNMWQRNSLKCDEQFLRYIMLVHLKILKFMVTDVSTRSERVKPIIPIFRSWGWRGLRRRCSQHAPIPRRYHAAVPVERCAVSCVLWNVCQVSCLAKEAERYRIHFLLYIVKTVLM